MDASERGLMLSVFSSDPGIPSRMSWITMRTCKERGRQSLPSGHGKSRTLSALVASFAAGYLSFCSGDPASKSQA
jgi:hypothetical protein